MAHEQARQDLRNQLVEGDPSGVSAMFWPVGSHWWDKSIPDPINCMGAVMDRVSRTAQNHQILFLPQLPARVTTEEMEHAPQHHPRWGLDASASEIRFDEEIHNGAIAGMTLDTTLDFSPDAAAGFYAVYERADKFSHVRLVKTEIASPGCARRIWPSSVHPATVDAVQSTIYPLLTRGHIARLNQLFPNQPIAVSVDNPSSPSGEAAVANIKMFGFDDAPPVLVAYHDCGGPQVSSVLPQVDILHVEHPACRTIFDGKASEVQDFINGNGMFAAGVVPNSASGVAELAKTCGMHFDSDIVRKLGMAGYDGVADWMRENREQAADAVAEQYINFVAMIAAMAGVQQETVARLCFISTTCGLGSMKHAGMQEVVYDLVDDVSNVIRDHHWS